MDDGGWIKHGVRISANTFTYSEVELLTQIFYRKFGLVTTIQKLTKLFEEDKDKYSIYIKSSSISSLRKIIQSHMDPSMLYKIGL